MSVAIDTNIIVYLLTGVATSAAAAAQALEDASSTTNVLVIAAPVYAELLALPRWTKSELEEFASVTKIRVDFALTPSCWAAAGMAYAAYSRRRSRQKIDAPRRILADFIIGAHALEIGSLLTADSAFYRTNFPELPIRDLNLPKI